MKTDLEAPLSPDRSAPVAAAQYSVAPHPASASLSASRSSRADRLALRLGRPSLSGVAATSSTCRIDSSNAIEQLPASSPGWPAVSVNEARGVCCCSSCRGDDPTIARLERTPRTTRRLRIAGRSAYRGARNWMQHDRRPARRRRRPTRRRRPGPVATMAATTAATTAATQVATQVATQEERPETVRNRRIPVVLPELPPRRSGPGPAGAGPTGVVPGC